MASSAEVTRWLQSMRAGDASVVDELMPVIYDELRALSRSLLARERRDHTLQATALANEAYMRLVDQRDQGWRNRAHFFAVASLAIRRILVDHARAAESARRGGDREREPLEDVHPAEDRPQLDLLALDQALRELAVVDERKARGVELRFFGGLRAEDVAEVQGVSVATVERDWSFSRAWLHRKLGGDAL